MLSRTIQSQYPAFLSLPPAENRSERDSLAAISKSAIGCLTGDLSMSRHNSTSACFLLKVASLLFASVSLFVDHNDLDARVQTTDKL